jgi:hypothetical protein
MAALLAFKTVQEAMPSIRADKPLNTTSLRHDFRVALVETFEDDVLESVVEAYDPEKSSPAQLFGVWTRVSGCFKS